MKHELVAILDAHGAALHAVLYRLTLRHDAADDLLQELFVRLAGSRGFAASDNAIAREHGRMEAATFLEAQCR